MSVLDRAALESSPLADLHAMASELSIDSYRRLRKPELIDAILARQEGTRRVTGRRARRAGGAGRHGPEELPDGRGARRGGRRRGSRTRSRSRRAPGGAAGVAAGAARRTREEESARRRRRRAGSAAERRARRASMRSRAPAEETVEGVVELVPNGSGFVRINPPEPSDDDVYISAAQVKRCELVSGDRVSGPRRAPRRSERFASLIRIDTINGRPAEEVADSARFDDLPAAFPTELLTLGAEDPTLDAIELVDADRQGLARDDRRGRRGRGRPRRFAGWCSRSSATRTCTCCSCWPGCAPRRSPTGRPGR